MTVRRFGTVVKTENPSEEVEKDNCSKREGNYGTNGVDEEAAN